MPGQCADYLYSYVYACSTISFLLYDILFAHLAYTQMISFFVSI